MAVLHKRDALNPKSGLTLDELENFLGTVRMIVTNGECTVHTIVGLRGQVKSIEVRSAP